RLVYHPCASTCAARRQAAAWAVGCGRAGEGAGLVNNWPGTAAGPASVQTSVRSGSIGSPFFTSVELDGNDVPLAIATCGDSGLYCISSILLPSGSAIHACMLKSSPIFGSI